MSAQPEQVRLSRDQALAHGLRLTIEAAERITPTPVLLIDGRSGAGKTHFANELADALFRELEQAPRVIHMDDLYPGWDGLRAGSLYLLQMILLPVSRGETARWQPWNWARSLRGKSGDIANGWREFEGGTPLIIEGCGSLSRASAELAHLTMWLHAETSVRRERWVTRDGDRFGEHWGRWAAQEDEFYEAEKSERLARIWLDNSAIAVGEPGSYAGDE